jgi:hypothetical protein
VRGEKTDNLAPFIIRAVLTAALVVAPAASGVGDIIWYDESMRPEKLLEIREGEVVFNAYGGSPPPAEVVFPFRYIVNNNQVPHQVPLANSLLWLNDRGEITHKDLSSADPLTLKTYFPAANGESYLTMVGVFRGSDRDNSYPSVKELYSRYGKVLWEKEVEGYPRLSPQGDFAAVFYASGFEGRITLIDEAGRKSEIKAPVGTFHGISRDGAYIVVGEPGSVPADWPGGTQVYTKTGERVVSLDPEFRCFTASAGEGDTSLYAGTGFFIQTGTYVIRRQVKDELYLLYGPYLTVLEPQPERGRGVQVYDTSGRKLWEMEFDDGHPGLQLFVAENEEYLALIVDPQSGIRVFKTRTGELVRHITSVEVPSSVEEGYISNDGDRILLFNHVSVAGGPLSGYEAGFLLLNGGKKIADKRLKCSEHGKLSGMLSGDGEFLLLTAATGSTVYKIPKSGSE